MKTYIYLKIFQFSCRIYCMLTLSLVSVALFFVTTFPVKAENTLKRSTREGYAENFPRQRSESWILSVNN